MTLSRRDFLKRSGLFTAGAIAAPSFMGGPFLQQAMADSIGDRYLVVLFLDGGNDGLNTVVPIDDPVGLRSAYEGARKTGAGGLRLLEGQLSIPSTVACADPMSGTALGLHPGLADIRSMYDEGNVAIVQGAGYPDYSLSHEASGRIWQSANPSGVAALEGTGWVGRHLDECYGPTDISGVGFGTFVGHEMLTAQTNVLATRQLSALGIPSSAGLSLEDRELHTDKLVLLNDHAASGAQSARSSLGYSSNASYQSTLNYKALADLYAGNRPGFDQAYSQLGSGLARNMRDIASCIYGVHTGAPGVDARFFQCRNFGYDTHADQGAADPNGSHFGLHQNLAQAVKLFFDDMADMGIGNKVTLMVYSEFGRRIPQNSSGTDHGSQGPMFVIGESVNGGIYGNHPDILNLDEQGNTVYSQDPLNASRSTDLRDVYGTLLKHWTNVPEGAILTDLLPPDSAALPASDYWTVPDFDMGFL